MNKFRKLHNLLMIEPIGCTDFIKLVKESQIVLTDLGGIQEETTVLKVPCFTIRNNTERPITITIGTNYLVWRDKTKIYNCIRHIFNG
jgi:UDP-N-acetylglucosamine 2-epimerase (non-hydrolysing)